MICPYGLDSWLALATFSESALLASLGPVRQGLLALGFPLDAWLIFSDSVSAVLILSPHHIRMKEVYAGFQDMLNLGVPCTLVGTPPENS